MESLFLSLLSASQSFSILQTMSLLLRKCILFIFQRPLSVIHELLITEIMKNVVLWKVPPCRLDYHVASICRMEIISEIGIALALTSRLKTL
jgi:hypothetical protein